MTKAKIKVLVGIPAFNEEGNIRYLIEDLLRQKQISFILDKIIVSSDGSLDNTVKVARGVNSRKIIVLNNQDRKGTANRQNQILKRAKSDIVILLNADISLKDDYFIDKLIKPILEERTDLVNCRITPLKPKSTIEKMLFSSIVMKRYIYEKLNGGNNIFTCHGSARAFSKKLYSQIRFIASVGEDSYSYLFCKYHHFNYAYVKETTIYYKLSDNLSDHQKQSIRYIQSINKFDKEFGKDFVNKQYGGSTVLFGIDPILTIEGFIYGFFKSPIYSVLYLLLAAQTRLKSFFAPAIPDMWEISTSSKSLRRSG